MRWIVRALLVVVGVLVLIVGLQIVASESGEVVVLSTDDENGESTQTRLWVVEQEGHPWLRSGGPQSGWYQRLLASETIAVERDEVVGRYVAEPVPAQQRAVNQLMREKYGWADGFISALYSRSDSIPIRLVPVE